MFECGACDERRGSRAYIVPEGDKVCLGALGWGRNRLVQIKTSTFSLGG